MIPKGTPNTIKRVLVVSESDLPPSSLEND